MSSTLFLATRILPGILCLATLLAIVFSDHAVLQKQSHVISDDRARATVTAHLQDVDSPGSTQAIKSIERPDTK